MRNLSILLLASLIASCSMMGGGEETVNYFDDFDAKFSTMQMEAFDSLQCSTLSFGDHHEMPHSQTLIHDTIIQGTIHEVLREKAGYVADLKHFALGKYALNEQVDAYLIGNYHSSQYYDVDMYLYDKQESMFIEMQNLDHTLNLSDVQNSQRTWLKDMNDDEVKDIVYRVLRNNSSTGESADKAWVEVWNGEHYERMEGVDDAQLMANYTIETPASMMDDLVPKSYDAGDEFGTGTESESNLEFEDEYDF